MAAVECEINGITLVAENVMTGIIKILDRNDLYYSEYQCDTGGAEPVNLDEFSFFNDDLAISSNKNIDVYVHIYSDTRSGVTNLRVDL